MLTEFELEGLEIESLGGYCPCQGEGFIDGLPFYFRARYEYWGMSIANFPDQDPIDADLGYGWYREEEWGNGPYQAGYMEPSEALEIIKECVTQFRKERDGNGPYHDPSEAAGKGPTLQQR